MMLACFCCLYPAIYFHTVKLSLKVHNCVYILEKGSYKGDCHIWEYLAFRNVKTSESTESKFLFVFVNSLQTEGHFKMIPVMNRNYDTFL